MTDKGKHGYFPLFTPCGGRVFLVIGGGCVATRRVRTLLQFDFKIRLVSPEASEEIQALADAGSIEWIRRGFEPDDLDGVSIAAACTDDRQINRLAGDLCHARNVPVSVADAPGECSYFFPAVACSESIVAGIAGDGRNHRAVALAARSVRSVLNADNGEVIQDE